MSEVHNILPWVIALPFFSGKKLPPFVPNNVETWHAYDIEIKGCFFSASHQTFLLVEWAMKKKLIKIQKCFLTVIVICLLELLAWTNLVVCLTSYWTLIVHPMETAIIIYYYSWLNRCHVIWYWMSIVVFKFVLQLQIWRGWRRLVAALCSVFRTWLDIRVSIPWLGSS